MLKLLLSLCLAGCQPALASSVILDNSVTSMKIAQGSSHEMNNLTVTSSASAGALTIAAKNYLGTDPSVTSVARSALRNGTLAIGFYNRRAISAPLSFTISSGTKLDFSTAAKDLYFYEIDSNGAGTMKIGAATNLVDETVLQTAVHESFTGTVTIASPGVWTTATHGLSNGAAVSITTTGALPTGLTAGTTYYLVSTGGTSFSLAATPGGSAINTTGTQSGVHTVHIADGRLVSDALYSSVPVRLIGRGTYTLVTPGTWLAATMHQSGGLYRVVEQRHLQTFTANGTWYTPPGTTANTVYKVTCVGGGGSGAGSTGSTGGGAGGGGGAAVAFVSGLAAETATSIIIGGGGGGVGAGAGDGNPGGTTTVTGLCVASGGGAGRANVGNLVGGAGGIGSTGDLLLGGSAGSGGYTVTGVSNIGGAGGGAALGGGGGAPGAGSNGGAGNKGGGGGGGTSGVNSGSGGNGFVTIEWNQ